MKKDGNKRERVERTKERKGSESVIEQEKKGHEEINEKQDNK